MFSIILWKSSHCSMTRKSTDSLDTDIKGVTRTLSCRCFIPIEIGTDAVFHEDHIFPQSEFQVRALKKRGYDDTKVQSYMSKYNVLPNLELLTDSENLSKDATPFDEWLRTRDATFRERHLIPDLPAYGFDSFEEFSRGRTALIVAALKHL